MHFVRSVPDGLEDVSTYPEIIAHLIDRGWGEEDIKKLIGKNLLRVFRAAEKVGKDYRPTTNN